MAKGIGFLTPAKLAEILAEAVPAVVLATPRLDALEARVTILEAAIKLKKDK